MGSTPGVCGSASRSSRDRGLTPSRCDAATLQKSHLIRAAYATMQSLPSVAGLVRLTPPLPLLLLALLRSDYSHVAYGTQYRPGASIPPSASGLRHTPSRSPHYRPEPFTAHEGQSGKPSMSHHRHVVGHGSFVGLLPYSVGFGAWPRWPSEGVAPLHPCIFREAKKGRCPLLRRAGGASLPTGKREKFPF